MTHLENGPAFIQNNDLNAKEELIYIAFSNLNNWITAMRNMGNFRDLDLLDDLLSKESKYVIEYLFKYKEDEHNPVKCIKDIKGIAKNTREITDLYLSYRNGVQGFTKLMRDCNAHLKDDYSLKLTHSGTMRYLLSAEHPSGKLIPKILRFIFFVLHEKYQFWFGGSFDVIAPLFCYPDDANGKNVAKLLLRVVKKDEVIKETDDVKYKLIKVDRDKPFYKIYQTVTNLTGIRLFDLEGLTDTSKRFEFSEMNHVDDERIILCIPIHQDIDELVKSLLKEHANFSGNAPDFEKTMLKMDKDKLWNDSYTAEMALQDTVLYFVDTYKFVLRLLQASDIQKNAWKAFIAKNEISDNHLIKLSSLCFAQDPVQKDVRLSPTVVFE